jgi:class 3 adenylate cyclase
MSDGEIRYCTTDDGVRIAYTAQGDGIPLVMCPFFVEGFAIAEKAPEYMEFVDGLGRGRRLVRFDMRGTGLSHRDAGDFTLQALTLDIKAVARALKLRRFVLYGAGLSGPRAVAYAAANPRDVSNLVLYSTFVRPDDVMPVGASQGFVEIARANWAMAAQALVDLSGRERVSDLNVRAAQMLRDSATGETAAQLLEGGRATSDVSSMLGDVRAPTLVIQSTHTQLFRAEFGRELASGIPNAQLRLFEANFNWLDPGAGTSVARMVDEFLGVQPAPIEAGRPPGPSASESGFRAVLFTDLVAHTEMMQRLGDAQGREVLREHERITRDALARSNGTEIKTDGDSFMATFSSISSAMDCAVALQRALAQYNEVHGEPIIVRMGLNVGEPIEEDGDFFGSTVILGARIKDQANGGEILVPEAVRHMLSGKNFSFVDRGEFGLKGFEHTVRLYEVRWRD